VIETLFGDGHQGLEVLGGGRKRGERFLFDQGKCGISQLAGMIQFEPGASSNALKRRTLHRKLCLKIFDLLALRHWIAALLPIPWNLKALAKEFKRKVPSNP